MLPFDTIVYSIERAMKKPTIKVNHSHLTNSGSMGCMCIFMYVWLWKQKWFLKCYSFIYMWYTWSPKKNLLHVRTLSHFLLWIVLWCTLLKFYIRVKRKSSLICFTPFIKFLNIIYTSVRLKFISQQSINYENYLVHNRSKVDHVQWTVRGEGFKGLFQGTILASSKGTEKDHERLSSNNQCLRPDLNWAPAWYMSYTCLIWPYNFHLQWYWYWCDQWRRIFNTYLLNKWIFSQWLTSDVLYMKVPENEIPLLWTQVS